MTKCLSNYTSVSVLFIIPFESFEKTSKKHHFVTHETCEIQAAVSISKAVLVHSQRALASPPPFLGLLWENS